MLKQQIVCSTSYIQRDKSGYKVTDGIPARFLKAGFDVLAEHLHVVLQKVWSEEEISREQNICVIRPILKKGNVKECSSYIFFDFLKTAYKILCIIHDDRLKPYLRNIVGPCQYQENDCRSDFHMTMNIRAANIYTTGTIFKKALQFLG